MNRLLPFLVMLLTIVGTASGQYRVDILDDLPDADLNDDVVDPPSLRAVLENVNKNGIPATIEISAVIERETILVAEPLPEVEPRITFEGKGIRLAPAKNSRALVGLILHGDGSHIKNLKVDGFPNGGIWWWLSNGVIEKTEVANCGSSGISLNNAHNNTIGMPPELSYYDIYLHDNTGTSGNGISIPARCTNNVVQYAWLQENSRSGARISGRNNTIRRCTIGGNEWAGITIDGDGDTLHTRIDSNLIGTSEQGSIAHGNGVELDFAGIEIHASYGDTIRGNLISGNGSWGVIFPSFDAHDAAILDNRIGTDRLMRSAIPNGGGMHLTGTGHVVRWNVVSGNTETGVNMYGRDMTFLDNIIGLDREQKLVLGNGGDGLWATMSGGTVVGDTTGANPNVIAGNGGHGIKIGRAGWGGFALGGFIIGANSDTSLMAPNSGDGIHVTYTVSDVAVYNNRIYHRDAAGIQVARNVVTFAPDDPRPPVIQPPYNIRLLKNRILWTDAGLKAPIRPVPGIRVNNADSTLIMQNTIVGATGNGIEIVNDSTAKTRVIENMIGGVNPNEPVGMNGVHVNGASDVLIGNPNDRRSRNTITGSGTFGVFVSSNAKQVMIHWNAMCGNEAGGIHLDSGNGYWNTGWNDLLDADDGSNGWQNTPRVTSGSIVGDSVDLKAVLRGKPNTTYRIDIYLDGRIPAAKDQLGEGCFPYDFFTVLTDAEGIARIDTVIKDPTFGFAGGLDVMTLTATGEEGTSGFSAIAPPPAEDFIDVRVVIDTLRSTVDPDGTSHLYATISNAGTIAPSVTTLSDSVYQAHQVETVTMSRGTYAIVPEGVTAEIASLEPGEQIEYHAEGRAILLGAHQRILTALTSEMDIEPSNNRDTIILTADNVSGILDQTQEYFTVSIENGVPVVRGDVQWYRVYDLLGRQIDLSDRPYRGPLLVVIKPDVGTVVVKTVYLR